MNMKHLRNIILVLVVFMAFSVNVFGSFAVAAHNCVDKSCVPCVVLAKLRDALHVGGATIAAAGLVLAAFLMFSAGGITNQRSSSLVVLKTRMNN